jgi:hypothetical protein
MEMSRNSEQAQAAEADADAFLAESMPGLLLRAFYVRPPWRQQQRSPRLR